MAQLNTYADVTLQREFENIYSDLKVFRAPNLTTGDKNELSAENGMFVYDTTLNKVQVYENGSWTNLV